MSISKWAELADEHNFPGDWAPYCCGANSRFLRSLSFPVSRAQLLSSWLQPNSSFYSGLLCLLSLTSYLILPFPCSCLLSFLFDPLFPAPCSAGLKLVRSWQQQGFFNKTIEKEKDGGEMGVVQKCGEAVQNRMREKRVRKGLAWDSLSVYEPYGSRVVKQNCLNNTTLIIK